MKRWAVLLAMLVFTLPTIAQQGKGERAYAKRDARPIPQRDSPMRDAGFHRREARHDGRMSPAERRQLRRDVHDHGRDIYHDRSGPDRR